MQNFVRLSIVFGILLCISTVKGNECQDCIQTPRCCAPEPVCKEILVPTYKKSFFDFDEKDLDNGWKVDGAYNPIHITKCGDAFLFGGFNVFGKDTCISKTFTCIPKHDAISITCEIYFIDSWDGEKLYLHADGEEIYQEGSQFNSHPKNICGWNAYGERISTFQKTFDHSKSDLELKFTNSLNQSADDESWGIRQCTLTILKKKYDCS